MILVLVTQSHVTPIKPAVGDCSMKRLVYVRPSPSLAISFVALLVAMGGTSYAVARLPSNSVGTAQIKPSGVSTSDIKSGAITSAKVLDGALQRVDFGAGQLPVGPIGPIGPVGPSGLSGPAGAPGPAGIGTVVVALGPDVPSGASGSGTNVQSSKAECPAGTVVTGGGFDVGVRDFIGTAEISGNGYFVISINVSSLASHVQAQAGCATGPGITSRAVARSPSTTDAHEKALLAQARTEAAATR